MLISSTTFKKNKNTADSSRVDVQDSQYRITPTYLIEGPGAASRVIFCLCNRLF